MTPARRHELDQGPWDIKLTDEELAEGWHWCLDFDGLLVGPPSFEAKYCTCNSIIIELEKNHEL